MDEMCVNIEQVEKIVENRAKLTEATMKGQFALVNEKLDRISESGAKTLGEARKTNGRVNVLEDNVRDLQEQDRTHLANCPMTEPIRVLQDKSLTNDTIKSTLWKIGAMLVATITFLMTLFAFIAGYL